MVAASPSCTDYHVNLIMSRPGKGKPDTKTSRGLMQHLRVCEILDDRWQAPIQKQGKLWQ